ncbi:hypothetical protein M011DRAFT_399755 [Sporormia fimetaria CBS 119925]|uniref:Rhodopsin domain-containing protein n=1 Tax=Sporormia fimetaria CBS 119925 TaxID=1340428 RepID=A0A6A6VED7_9PLEO|nr:hypothetical protein M011DRAFT_399755 [Sporormia fimetaria CBS 119925]
MTAPRPQNVSELSFEVSKYSNAPALRVQTNSLFSIAAVVVTARCYARIFVKKSFENPDQTQVLATIWFVCYQIEISLGIGRYMAVIQANPDNYRTILLLRQIHMTVVVMGLSVVKISIALFLLRLVTRKAYQLFLWGLIVFLTLFSIACLGTLICQCENPRAVWDVRLRPPPEGTGTAKCFNRYTFRNIGLFNGTQLTFKVINILTDFLLALLPVPLVWTLQLRLRTRISLVLILALGIFAGIAGIVRQLSPSQFKMKEAWIEDQYNIWNFVELTVGIIAASLPALKPLFTWFFEAARGKTRAGESFPMSGYGSRKPRAQQYRAQRSDPSLVEGRVDIFHRGGVFSVVENDRGHSEDGILPKLDGKVPSEILVTTQVDVKR